MPRTQKKDEHAKRVPRGNRKLTKVEPLRPQVDNPEKYYNDLAKFPSENPCMVLRIHKDGTVLYTNRASEPLLKAKDSAVGKPAPKEWYRLVEKVLASGRIAKEEVKYNGQFLSIRAVPITESDYVNFYGTDITEQKMAEEEREITIKLLSLINSRNQIHDLMKLVTAFLKDWSGCEDVGIRLQEGEDFPYFETNGFPDEFVKVESKLCSMNEIGEPVRDSRGRVFLECMCGNVISGRFDPTKPFFTERGSFWTNSTTALLASTTNADRMTKTRNRCNTAGYESVALVPLRAGKETLGLLQFNSKQKDRFTPAKISLLERLADNLAIGLAQRKAEESLRESETRYRSLFDNMLDGFAYCRMLFDHGQPQDFIYLDVNESFEKLTGLKNVVGRRATEIIPEIKESNPELFEIYGKVALTGQPERFETYLPSLKIWFSISAYSPQKEYFTAVFENVTERKHAEEALQASEERLKEASNAAELGIWDWNLVSGQIKWEGHHARLFGFKENEFDGRFETFEKRIHHDDIAGLKAAVEKAKKDQTEYSYEYRVIWPDGTVRWLTGKGRCQYDQTGQAVRMLGTVQDITERKQAEEKLRESEEKYRAVIETTDTGFVSLDEKGRVLNANLNYAQMVGYSSVDKIIGRQVTEWTAPYDSERNRIEVSKCFNNGSVRNLEIDYRCADGSIVPAEINANVVQTKNGRMILTLCRDITERKQTEQKILDYQKRLKQLASQLTLIEEQERRQIAGDIHDEISQTLAMAKIKLDALRSSPPSEWSSIEIKQISSSIEKVIQDTRELTFELSNPILYELGFEAAAAEWLNDNVHDKHGIATEFHDDGQPKPLDDDLKVMLFRNVRELLTNCIKHAKAGKIRVSIRKIDNSIQVIVEDNGAGFDQAQLRTTAGKKGKLGLFSIRESMENTGGSFEIQSKPGTGCKAIMMAPLKSATTDKEI